MIAALLFAVSLSGFPIKELPATAPESDRFAVMLTGDGGWRRVDEEVAKPLRASGIPVVGFLASDYYRKRRTPEESAQSLEQVIRFYQTRWNKRNVILIGYSRGADALPFMLSRLPQDLRRSTTLVALLGLESLIDFKYNPPWTIQHWFSHEPQVEVLPELQKLRGMPVICVYGEKEADSLCPSLDPAAFTIVREPGGHHFAGKYREIGERIVTEANRSR